MANGNKNCGDKSGCNKKGGLGEFHKTSERRCDFSVADLLCRSEVDLLDEEVAGYYAGKTVLVTGGGGSIGSEICRLTAKCKPKRLIVFDIYENNAYEIEQELRRTFGGELDLKIVIGSVRDRDRLNAVFAAYKPDAVFHAAAHKHVPLMEDNCGEAVKNNVFGTYNAADAAEKFKTEKFVLVSTDKAVNPVNVMGATKRLCEKIVQSRTDGETVFSAVRFGNVLGSNGSVVPLFKKQIELGGPITVTDRRVTRYFMTVGEAARLVMSAGVIAKKGDLFVLDMGSPVKIWDLAETMIKLSGRVPHKDVEIKEIGLRHGEKLYEELLIKPENLKRTSNEKIFIESDEPLSRGQIDESIENLKKVLKSEKDFADPFGVISELKKIVPEFGSTGEQI